MSNAPQIAEVAALVGDPARANMLVALSSIPCIDSYPGAQCFEQSDHIRQED
jgi:hypothetical protein